MAFCYSSDRSGLAGLARLALHALAQLDLAPQAGQSQIYFFDLKLIRFRIGTRKKKFICCKRLIVFSKIIMRGGNEIMSNGQIWFRSQEPFILPKRLRILLELI